MNKWKILNDAKPKNTPDVITALLENRGIKTQKEKEEFLNLKIDNVEIENVGIDKEQVQKTLERIKEAIKKNEWIIIYGDYDVDGICGATILWETLYKYYKNSMPYIPHRVDEGYGISKKGIDNVIDKYPDTGLIITVDNGIVATDAIEYSKKKGIDVVITDHHAKPKDLPNAYSIVHTTVLCGAGVAYLLAQEIKYQISNIKILNNEYEIQDTHLELVALATIADLVPLNVYNRALVREGLKQLRQTKRPGLNALINETKIRKSEIDTYHIGFIIGPRLNASGRIGHALDSLRLLCTKDEMRARQLAFSLCSTNKDRQVITFESAEHADSITGEIDSSQKFIVVSNPEYNQGIIGLVASRLVEKHYRPAIVIAEGEKLSKGSARSIKGFNIIEFIREHRHFLVDAGGHPMAAGFTIETEKIMEFKNALMESSSKVISEEMLERKIEIDMELEFSLVTKKLYDEIKKLSPFGMGNPEPLFVTRGLTIKNIRRFGKEDNHMELLFGLGAIEGKGIIFNVKDRQLTIGESADVVFSIYEDKWNGSNKLQLKIKDLDRK